jgi:2,4-dienoyl-CoA reductase-like NADH-dependent reductase (Old Yellow Enzyme family)
LPAPATDRDDIAGTTIPAAASDVVSRIIFMQQTRKTEREGVVAIPVIIAGRILAPDAAEGVLQAGSADFVSLGPRYV